MAWSMWANGVMCPFTIVCLQCLSCLSVLRVVQAMVGLRMKIAGCFALAAQSFALAARTSTAKVPCAAAASTIIYHIFVFISIVHNGRLLEQLGLRSATIIYQSDGPVQFLHLIAPYAPTFSR